MSLAVAAYARRIERHWGERIGRPVVLSPRDWETLLDWHARAIPLQVVEEAIDLAAERARERGHPPRGGLAAVASAVEAAWQTILAGRIERESGEREPALAPESAWRERVRAEPCDSPLRLLLDALLARLDGGASPASVDDELERSLPGATDSRIVREVASEIERDIARARQRISAAALTEVRQIATIRRLRQRLGLPRLAEPPSIS